jgi:ferredoxin-NADP reductase
VAWRVSTVVDVRTETSTARTLVLDVPDWPGHLPGQHVDVRLTAPDGYSTQRSYSIASAPDANRVELTVQRVDEGEVSPYLTDVLAAGYPLELRGPVGGWFVWRPEDAVTVLLVAGGSGIVPLMAMIRTRAAVRSRAPVRLVYSVRSPTEVYYADELRRRGHDDPALEVAIAYTRAAPEGWTGPVGRITPETLTAHGWPATLAPACFVCGPTGFVEATADILVALGHAPHLIRTERFGPSGGDR